MNEIKQETLRKSIEEKSNYAWGSKLLTIENAKTIKGELLGYLTGILYLAPSDISVEYGGKNICPWASPGCRSSCLYSSGRGRFTGVQSSRISKTLKYLKNREEFLSELNLSIEETIFMAKRKGMTPCFRLNGTSDIGWDKLGVMSKYPDQIFYDYTKSKNRVLRNTVDNWNLTFSKSETNDIEVEEVIETSDINVAIVFDTGKKENLPKSYMGRRVTDCDMHDLRFLDDRGIICGLRAKGKGKKDKSGFVVKKEEKMIDKSESDLLNVA